MNWKLYTPNLISKGVSCFSEIKWQDPRKNGTEIIPSTVYIPINWKLPLMLIRNFIIFVWNTIHYYFFVQYILCLGKGIQFFNKMLVSHADECDCIHFPNAIVWKSMMFSSIFKGFSRFQDKLFLLGHKIILHYVPWCHKWKKKNHNDIIRNG